MNSERRPASPRKASRRALAAVLRAGTLHTLRRLPLALWVCLVSTQAGETPDPARLPLAASPFRDVLPAIPATPARRKVDDTRGNRALILNDGDDALLVRCHLIRTAVRSIDIQTFIWSNDEVGRFVMRELIQAARRGVRVRIIADHFVSHKDADLTAFLATAHPNLEIKHYRPMGDRIRPGRHHLALSLLTGFRGLNQRMHNKLMVFDDAVAITGGRNIENTYFNRSTGMNFKDRDILVVGPIVSPMVKSFEEFWDYRHSVPSAELRDVVDALAKSEFKRYDRPEDFVIDDRCDDIERDSTDDGLIRERFVAPLLLVRSAEFVADKPGKNRSWGFSGSGNATERLARAVKRAEGDILIQSPYFVLSDATRKLLGKMRRDNPGLRLTVSTNSFGSTDNTMAYSAAYKLRGVYLTDLGIRIYEYKPQPADLLHVWPAYDRYAERAREEAGTPSGNDPAAPFLCLHAKSLVVDESTAFIGSFNLDPRSENLNTEVGVLVKDETFAALLRRDILRDTRPGNSWVIARKQMPLSLDTVNGLVEGIMRKSPLDLWPVRNTSSFELLPGREGLPPEHPDFYEHYRDIGSFPGAPAGLSTKEITTRLYKVVGGIAVPIL